MCQQGKITYEVKEAKKLRAAELARLLWSEYYKVSGFPSVFVIIHAEVSPVSPDPNLSEVMHACKHWSRTFRDSGQRCPSQFIKWLNETLVATMPFKQTRALFPSLSCYLVMRECDYCSLVWMQLLCLHRTVGDSCDSSHCILGEKKKKLSDQNKQVHRKR